MSPYDMPSISTGAYRHTLLERVIHGQPFDQVAMAEVLAQNARRVLIIAAPRSQGSAALAQLQAALGDRYAGVFCGVRPHVPVQCVHEGAVLARQLQADHLIAFGGGSVIDAAKAIALLVHAGPDAQASALLSPQDLREVDPSRHSDIAAHWLRITAIPFTLSAAEFTWFAGISDPVQRVKNLVAHAAMAPRCVILDPRLTLDIPLSTFLASGVKAMDHAIERLVALQRHPLSDAVGHQALRMLSVALPAVQCQPDDLHARQQCQLASWLSIVGGSAGVKTGASHALGHVLGAHAGIAHGATSCVLLAPVLRWNAPYNQAQQQRVMALLGEPSMALADWVARFVSQLGLPHRLRDLHVSSEDLPAIAQKSLDDPGMRKNPRPIQSAAAALEILQDAW